MLRYIEAGVLFGLTITALAAAFVAPSIHQGVLGACAAVACATGYTILKSDR